MKNRLVLPAAALFIVFVFVFAGCEDHCVYPALYGNTSFTKSAKNICAKKLAGDGCYPDSMKDVKSVLDKMQRYKLVFYKDTCCEGGRDSNGHYICNPVECPDFIPETINMTKFAGCQVYSNGYTDCVTDCPGIFFETDNDYFKKAAFINTSISWELGKLDHIYIDLFRFQSIDGKVTFYCPLDQHIDYQIFFGEAEVSWTEEGTDGTEIRKEISVHAEIISPDAVVEEPVQDSDDPEMPDE